jgi:hypothetical protein
VRGGCQNERFPFVSAGKCFLGTYLVLIALVEKLGLRDWAEERRADFGRVADLMAILSFGDGGTIRRCCAID